MMNFLRKQMKWVMAIIVIAFLLSTFLMYEGRGTRRTPTRNADGSMSDYEVAQINGRSLMRSELETRLRNYLSNYSSRTTASLDMAALYQTVLDQAVLDSQLAKEVEERGIRISDAEAEMAMKNYADTYYPTRETFYQVLAQSGIKVDDYKKTLARQMAIDTLLNQVIGDVDISEDRAVEFYDTMKNLVYSKPEGFMIHMADFNNNAAAENFRTRLLNGESWDVIISNDDIPSADVINITRESVFLPSTALTTGTLITLNSVDISEPTPVFEVASEDYAVAVKESHVDESVTPYEEVSADIKTLLTQQEQRKRLSDYEEELKTKATLVINDTELFARPEVSADETPQFSIEDIKIEDVSTDEEATPEVEAVEEVVTEEKTPATIDEPKVEEVEAVVESEAEETEPEVEEEKEEEAKPVEAEKVEEPVTEEPTSESESVTEKTEEAEKIEEPVVEETVTEEIKEEPKTEEAPETPATEEKAPEAIDEPNAEEVEAVVESEAEAKESASEEKAPEVEEVKEEAKPAEAEKIEEPVTEEPTPESENVAEEVTESENVEPVAEEVVVTESETPREESTKEEISAAVDEIKEEAKTEDVPEVVEVVEAVEPEKVEEVVVETVETPAAVDEATVIEEKTEEKVPEISEVVEKIIENAKSEDISLQEELSEKLTEAVTELVEKVEDAAKE